MASNVGGTRAGIANLAPGQTYVPSDANGSLQETAQALLAAADEAGLPQAVVRYVGDGFIVPDALDPNDDQAPDEDEEPVKKTAKKAAKKTTAPKHKE